MSNLETCELGDLIEFQRGYDLPKSKFIYGPYPVQSSNGILGYHNEYKVLAPGITIGRSGTVGLPHLLKTNFFPHNTTLFIKDFKNNDVAYIYYLLKYLKLGDKKSGSGVPTMNRNHLHPLKIKAYKDLNNQKNVAKIFSVLDEKIGINNQINAELEAMAKTLYDYWFVQFDFPDANGKPYKSSGGKMVYNETLKRDIPAGWEVCKLENIIKIHDSKRVPLSAKQREERKGEFPYYGATSIMDYVNGYIFDGEYVLLAEDGSVMNKNGFPVLQYIFGKTWVNNHAHVLEASSGYSNPLLHLFLQNIPVISMMSGSIQKKINQNNLCKTPILHPATHILEKINPVVGDIYAKLMETKKENNFLEKLRDWLLPMLMNGQVVVK